MSEKTLIKLMLFWAYFIGIGALWGVAMFLVDPGGVMWGMEPILPVLRDRLPVLAGLFNDFYASAVALLLVVALPNAVAVVLTHKRNRYAATVGAVCGAILMGWTGFELYIWGDEPLSLAYLLFGAIQMAIGVKADYTLKKDKK